MKSIRSVLVSLGCTTNLQHNQMNRTLSARQLNNDFRELLGHPIPFREFGYNHIDDFLRDIPDVVSVQIKQGELHVQAVSDKSVANIEKMVGRQKESTAMARKTRIGSGQPMPSRRRGPPQGRPREPPYRGPPYRGPQNNSMTRPQYTTSYQMSSTQSYPASRTQYQPPQRYQASLPTVPPLIRGYIRDVLTSYPNGILGSNFDIAFTRNFNGPLVPNSLGFNSLVELLRSIPEIAIIEELPNGYKIRPKPLIPQKGSMLKTHTGLFELRTLDQ